MRTDFERVSLTAEGAVAILALNHPDSLNAIGPRMARGFSAALAEVENPKHGFRVLLLTGEGRAFCSGANLSEPPESGGPLTAGAILDEVYHPLLRRLRGLKLPIVTAVNGVAAADFWGTKNAGVNYGFLFTAWGVAGIIGPRIGGVLYDRYHDYQAAFYTAAALAGVALLCELGARRPALRL